MFDPNCIVGWLQPFRHHSERRLLLGVKYFFVLTDHILSEIICLFCFCVLFPTMYPDIKLTAKNWPDLCIFIGKWVSFFNFCGGKYFFFFRVCLNYSCFYNNIYSNTVNILEKFNKRNGNLRLFHLILNFLSFKQTVQTLISRRILLRLIRVCNVCQYLNPGF